MLVRKSSLHSGITYRVYEFVNGRTVKLSRRFESLSVLLREIEREPLEYVMMFHALDYYDMENFYDIILESEEQFTLSSVQELKPELLV